MEFEVDYRTKEDVGVKVACFVPSYSTKTKESGYISNGMYAVRIYADEESPGRKTVYETLWLHPLKLEYISESLEERVRHHADQGTSPEGLYGDLDGFLDEVEYSPFVEAEIWRELGWSCELSDFVEDDLDD